MNKISIFTFILSAILINPIILKASDFSNAIRLETKNTTELCESCETDRNKKGYYKLHYSILDEDGKEDFTFDRRKQKNIYKILKK